VLHKGGMFIRGITPLLLQLIFSKLFCVHICLCSGGVLHKHVSNPVHIYWAVEACTYLASYHSYYSFFSCFFFPVFFFLARTYLLRSGGVLHKLVGAPQGHCGLQRPDPCRQAGRRLQQVEGPGEAAEGEDLAREEDIGEQEAAARPGKATKDEHRREVWRGV